MLKLMKLDDGTEILITPQSCFPHLLTTLENYEWLREEKLIS